MIGGFVLVASAPSSSATMPPAAVSNDGPVFDLWYGPVQTFGAHGQPQPFDNVVGNVSDPDGVATLSYSLNGGRSVPLSIGGNGTRLVAPGDFNVELPVTDLRVGNNRLHLVASDRLGHVSSTDVTVKRCHTQSWPLTYSADWSATGGNPNSVAQVVDGRWEIKPDGTLHNTQSGYDRVVAIGDANTWSSYAVTAPITINAMDPGGAAVGIVTGWQGHTYDLNGVLNLDPPRVGHLFPAAFMYSSGPGQPPTLGIDANTRQHPEQLLAVDPSGMQLQLGVPYTFQAQVTTNRVGGSPLRLQGVAHRHARARHRHGRRRRRMGVRLDPAGRASSRGHVWQRDRDATVHAGDVTEPYEWKNLIGGSCSSLLLVRVVIPTGRLGGYHTCGEEVSVSLGTGVS